MLRFVPSKSVLALVAVGTVVVSALTLLRGRRRATQYCRLLPGPVPLPLVGSIFSIDPAKPWLTYTGWKARYGDIFMMRVLNQDIIVISSAKIARDLLERRSSIYSDRPYIATRIPYGWGFAFAFTPYGQQWRSRRRIFHQAFRAEATAAFQPIQAKGAHQLILDILNVPHDYPEHIQRFAAAVIMSVVYDYEVSEHDPLVELFERGIVLAAEALTPETSAIVGAFPFGNLPEWFPGGSFRRKARISSYCVKRMIEEPFKHATKREAMGSSAPAMALDLLKRSKDIDDPSQLQLLKDTCASAFIAGAETISSTLMYFMLTMVQNPKVQEWAHAEIDAVVGPDRLPTIDDRPNLPYVEAILIEVLRMYTVVPLGLPHATTADDIYEDFFIPKGKSKTYDILAFINSRCTIVANVWAMYHDESLYPEPEIFKPERFLVDGRLSEDAKFVDSLAFGFGRRVCPGRYFADGSLWAALVSILWAFKITKALDERGEEIDFEPTLRSGVATAPRLFPCSITVRRANLNIPELPITDL